MIKKFLNKKRLLLLVSFFYLFTNINIYGMDEQQQQQQEKEKVDNIEEQNLKIDDNNQVQNNKIVINANRDKLIDLLKKNLNDKKTNFNNILPKIKKEEDKDNKFEFEEIKDNKIKNNFNAKVKLYFTKIEKIKLIEEINKFKGNNINEENKEKIENEIKNLNEDAEKLLGKMFISVNSQGIDLTKNKTKLDNAQTGRNKLKTALKKAYTEQDKDYDKISEISKRKKNLERIKTLNKTIEKILTKLNQEIFFNFLSSKSEYKKLYKDFLITNIKDKVSDFDAAIKFINSKIGEYSNSNETVKNQLQKIKNNLTHYNKIINNASDITKDNIDDRTMRDFLLNNDVILANENKYIKASTRDSYYKDITDTDITSTIHKDVYLKDNTEFETIYLQVSKLKDDLVDFLRNLKINENIDAIYKDNNEKVVEDFKVLAEITLKKHFENEKEEIKEKTQKDISNFPDNDKKNEEIKKLKEKEEKDIKEATEKYEKNSKEIIEKIKGIVKNDKIDFKEDKNELTKALDLSSLNSIDSNIFKSFSKISEIFDELKKPVNHYLIYTSKVKSMDFKSKTTTTTTTVAAASEKTIVGDGTKHGGGKNTPAKSGKGKTQVKGNGINQGRTSKTVTRKQTRKQIKKAAKTKKKKNNNK